jgi:hypothetical protein
MFNFLNAIRAIFPSGTPTVTTDAALTVPPFPVHRGARQDAVKSFLKVRRGEVMLWSFLRTLMEVVPVSAEDRTTSINVIYDHFLAFSGLTNEEVSRRQFGVEINRWIRENHLPLRVTKPKSSAVHVVGIDESILKTAFQN